MNIQAQPFDIELVGGPQDGGKVVQFTGNVRPIIYVGRRHMGDGHVAFGDEYSARFPVRYTYDGRRYMFTNLQTI